MSPSVTRSATCRELPDRAKHQLLRDDREQDERQQRRQGPAHDERSLAVHQRRRRGGCGLGHGHVDHAHQFAGAELDEVGRRGVTVACGAEGVGTHRAEAVNAMALFRVGLDDDFLFGVTHEGGVGPSLLAAEIPHVAQQRNEPQAGAAFEFVAVVTLHAAQSCRDCGDIGRFVQAQSRELGRRTLDALSASRSTKYSGTISAAAITPSSCREEQAELRRQGDFHRLLGHSFGILPALASAGTG